MPDLAPTAFSAYTPTITKGNQTTVSWTVKNQGSGIGNNDATPVALTVN